MLGQALKSRQRLLQPFSIGASGELINRQYVQLIDIFRKDKAEERKRKLQEECSQGYWDDFKELKDSRGKLYQASNLIPPTAASVLPPVQVQRPDSTVTTLHEEANASKVSLLCVAFRGGAEEMLASWSLPFSQGQHAELCQHLELSIVESAVMAWWPFKGMILSGNSREAEAAGLKPKHLFQFSATSPFIAALQLTNRLTGYVFLLDNEGRVRWRGSGQATADEKDRLMIATDKLVRERLE